LKLCTLSHQRSGWNQPWLPALDSSETLVVAFGTARLDEEGTALEELRRSYPRSALVGCSTSGEIFGTKVRDDSLVVAVAHFEKTRIRTAFHAVNGGNDSRAAGTELAQELAAPDLRGVLVLADGVHVNGSDLMDGLHETLPHQAVVVGGLAGDGDRFHSTWVLVDRHPRPNHVCAVGFYGDSVRIHSDRDGGSDLCEPWCTSSEVPASAPPALRATGDVLSLAILGVGRRIALGARTERETEAVFKPMAPKTQQIGFVSYGAISPRPGGRGLDLHPSTMTVTSIGES
jgi:hypothetical protein